MGELTKTIIPKDEDGISFWNSDYRPFLKEQKLMKDLTKENTILTFPHTFEGKPAMTERQATFMFIILGLILSFQIMILISVN